MAQITVCDVCGKGITPKDDEPFDFRKCRLSVSVQIHNSTEWKKADICRYCLIDALASQDDRPKAG
jgi:hypothetical protein